MTQRGYIPPPLSFPKVTFNFSNSKQDVCGSFRMARDGHPETVRLKLMVSLKQKTIRWPFLCLLSFGHSKESKVATRAKHQAKNNKNDWMSVDEH